MKKIAMLMLCMASLLAVRGTDPLPSDSVLRRQAARMLMVGFKGDAADDKSDAARYVRDLHVGAIVLFDVDLTGTAKIGSRNITSKDRLVKLTEQLHGWSDQPLIVTLDQEGGLVARLKPQYGFKPTRSAKWIGRANSVDTTRRYARQIAKDLRECGINLNLAPVVDLDDPNSPAIGGLDRGFASDPAAVAKHAGWWIDEHRKQGVACALKHFPGHGSSRGDSHYGLVDVTDTWSAKDMEPFRRLIDAGDADAIMTAHIYNLAIDPQYPATLSKLTIDSLLRGELGFDGVVISDDMYMEGIISEYGIEEALALAINAGVDMLCVGNNIKTGFEPDRPFRLVDMIVNAVREGKIPAERLAEANRRIDRLARKADLKERPLMVGHRGSLYGVENTGRSFANGARMGYQYLETDVRMTADSVLVCSHDEDNIRLGGSLKIADATLAELKVQPLRQTRRNLRFEGEIATLEEYLDTCRALGALPLIELKWGTGINSKDCSNIPVLIDLIESKGFRGDCIILTSMKPCLEYIRTNYPDIQLQFLTGKYWPNHFDWCKQWRMDVDIQGGFFDEETVKKFHDEGLKVNVWTIDDPAAAEKYASWGCDFITTDFLK